MIEANLLDSSSEVSLEALVVNRVEVFLCNAYIEGVNDLYDDVEQGLNLIRALLAWHLHRPLDLHHADVHYLGQHLYLSKHWHDLLNIDPVGVLAEDIKRPVDQLLLPGKVCLSFRSFDEIHAQKVAALEG